jgi:hypothetical protein
LLAKIQERRGGNQKVQLISAKPHGVDPRVLVITRGDAAIGEDRVTLGKIIEESRVRRVEEKTQDFDPNKEK